MDFERRDLSEREGFLLHSQKVLKELKIGSFFWKSTSSIQGTNLSDPATALTSNHQVRLQDCPFVDYITNSNTVVILIWNGKLPSAEGCLDRA